MRELSGNGNKVTIIASNMIDNQQNANMLLYVVLFAVFELFNMIFLGSDLALCLSIPQIVIVLILIAQNKLEKALIWHVIFNVTACDLNTLDEDVVMLSYPALKLIGPLTISYILLGLLWLKSLKQPVITPKTSLFYQFRRLFLFLFLAGTALGILGLFIGTTTISGMVSPIRYLGVAVLYIDIFSRLYKRSFMLYCTKIAICLLIASPIVSFISFFLLRFSYGYSAFESFIANSIFVLSPCLLLYMLFKIPNNVRILMILSLLCFLVLSITSGRGSQFMTFAVVCVLLVCMVYIKHDNRSQLVGLSFFRLILPFCFFGIFTYGALLLMNVGDSLAANKLSQFVSLFSVFSDGQLSLDNVGSSPYIRMAEVLNILDNGIQNPFYLIIGKGYGSYYTDSLRLFAGLDLSAGAFGDEAIRTGHFNTAHSMTPNALLFHGLIGFFLICRLGLRYLKKIIYTPLIFAAFSLLLYSLYYNVPLMNACIMFLFASEAYIKYNTIESK